MAVFVARPMLPPSPVNVVIVPGVSAEVWIAARVSPTTARNAPTEKKQKANKTRGLKWPNLEMDLFRIGIFRLDCWIGVVLFGPPLIRKSTNARLSEPSSGN